MRRTYAKATAAELAAWKRRLGASVREAAAWLGIGERTMTRFLSGRQRIPLTLAKLTSALTYIDLLKRSGPMRESPLLRYGGLELCQNLYHVE